MRTILRTCSRKGNLYLSLNAVSLLLPRFKSSSLGKGDKVTEFKVDRSGLIDFKLPSMPSAADTPSDSSTESVAKESTTPLGRDLYSYILAKGPITVHEFMTQAANHSEHGYYQNKIGQIGAWGDFITAPEISQLFGEMVGLWLVANWQAMGSPPRVNIVELGPGNGVLMRDVLKTLKKFPALQKAMEIHLVELSQRLRHVQAATITGSAPSDPATSHNDQPFAQIEYDGCKISWHPFFSEVPKDVPLFVIAQEFLDVFPVHQFVFGPRGWGEKLVDIDDSPHSPLHFRMVRSPSPTPALQLILGSRADKASPYSYLCSVIDKAGLKHDEGVEVSPLALGLVQEISRAVSDGGGAALLIDYGEDFTAADSLRGFHKHKVVNVLSQPGEVDVTADVDFSAAAKVALQNDAWVAPLLTQGEFLMRMGIAERLSALIDLPQTSEEQAEQLFDAFTMLVAPEHMGTKFKALAISNKSLQGKLVGFADSTPSSTAEQPNI